MTPRLPPELLSHILALAQEGQHPVWRQSTRNKFKQVCRDWYRCLDPWKEVCVQSPSQAERLTKVLSAFPDGGGRPLGLRVKSVGFSFRSDTNARAAECTAGLLSAIPQIERCEFRARMDMLSVDRVIGRPVAEALVRLKHVKHFAVWQVGTRAPSVDESLIKRSASHYMYQNHCEKLINCAISLLSCWPNLESFILQANPTGPPRQISFASQSNLRTLDINRLDYLPSVPPTLRSVCLSGYRVSQPDTVHPAAGAPAELCDNLLPVAPYLVELELHGSCAWEFGAPVGCYHARLMSALRDVRFLSIPAFAVADLAGALVRLAHLQEVAVACPGRSLAAARAVGIVEVVRFLLNAPVLRKLTLAATIVIRWSAEGRQVVREVAKHKGIKLVDAGGWEG